MRIVYNDDEGLKILIPSNEIHIAVIADKDVPANILYKIVEDSEIPQDRATRSEWEYEITEANADGRGLTKDEFYAKYPDLVGWAVKE